MYQRSEENIDWLVAQPLGLQLTFKIVSELTYSKQSNRWAELNRIPIIYVDISPKLTCGKKSL